MVAAFTHFCKKPFDRPSRLSKSTSHSWRLFEISMLSAEIVRRYENVLHSNVVLQWLRKCVGQSSVTTIRHSQLKIPVFNEACWNHWHIRIAETSYLFNWFYLCWWIANSLLFLLITLDQLGEVNATAKSHWNSVRVSSPAVSCQLKASGGCVVQLLKKRIGSIDRAISDMVSKDQFCFAVDRNKCCLLYTSDAADE